MDKKLRLSRTNKVMAGVCGGFAEYFGVDPTLVRVIWVILMFITFHVPMIAVYIVCWAIMPHES